MSHPEPDLALPHGWQSSVVLNQNADGSISAKAELRQDKRARCVFVVETQEGRDAALARLQFRADHFIREWEARAASEPGK